jgi:hypothetical protein
MFRRGPENVFKKATGEMLEAEDYSLDDILKVADAITHPELTDAYLREKREDDIIAQRDKLLMHIATPEVLPEFQAKLYNAVVDFSGEKKKGQKVLEMASLLRQATFKGFINIQTEVPERLNPTLSQLLQVNPDLHSEEISDAKLMALEVLSRTADEENFKTYLAHYITNEDDIRSLEYGLNHFHTSGAMNTVHEREVIKEFDDDPSDLEIQRQDAIKAVIADITVAPEKVSILQAYLN